MQMSLYRICTILFALSSSPGSYSLSSPCGASISATRCDEMLASPVVPAFVKLHKVGSTTLSLFLECVQLRTSLHDRHLGPWLRSCSDSTLPDAVARGQCCRLHHIFDDWSGPWSHRVMQRYVRGELQGILSSCLPSTHEHYRVITLLRDPRERFW